MSVTCDPVDGFVWTIKCGKVCEDGMATALITKKTIHGDLVLSHIFSRGTKREFVAGLRKLLPPELLETDDPPDNLAEDSITPTKAAQW